MPYYTISAPNLDLLLQLGKSAQFTLSTVLHQANGTSEVKVDRSKMTNAEQQKLKRGLQELVNQGIISQVSGTRGTYKIDDSVIAYSSTHTTTSSQNPPKSPFATKTTSAKQRIPKEPYGNRPEKQFNFDKMIDALHRKQKLAEFIEQREKESVLATARMWSQIKNYRQSKTYKIDPIYSNLPGNDTSSYIAACSEFLDEITNETFFFDIDNEIMHDNKLMAQFQRSIKSYDKRYQDNKRWNILIELGAIKTIANHTQHCLDLAVKNKACNCYDACRNKFLALVKNDVKLTRLDSGSVPEHSDLHIHFEDWVSSNYPELFV